MKDLGKILKDAKISQQEIADLLGIKSLGTVSLKVNRKTIVTTEEARKIKNLINKKTGSNYTISDLFDNDSSL